MARTTVTLDPDVEAIVRRVMRERRLTFKQAVNEAIRAGHRGPVQTASPTPVFHMGAVSEGLIDKAIHIAGQLEDDEVARKLAARR